MPTSHALSSALLEQLEAVLGRSHIIRGDELRQRPISHWNAKPTEALALLRPTTTEQVSDVLRFCHQFDQPVVTQGGRTGCAQGAEALPNELILSLERMTAIESIDTVGGTVTVQAGAILEVVQQAVLEHQWCFPLDLGARGSCTIGGNVATNAGGINVLRYGMMRQLLLGLEAVLADGTVVSSMNQMLKNNSGFDLKQLFVGTEGCLGVVTRAVLRLYPKPLSCQSALVALERFEDVAELLNIAQRSLAGTLSAYEVMWGDYFHRVTEPGGHRPPLSRDYPYYVMLEAEGADPHRDDERFQRLMEQALEDGLIVDAVLPQSESERRQLWEIRENFEALYQQGPTYLYDISLPITHMPAYVDDVKRALATRWPSAPCYVIGHIADGNLHLFITPPNDGNDHHAEADQDVYQSLLAYGGAVSAEHGIGFEKKPWLGYSRSATEMELMRQLKRSLDPKSLLNPGRVFDLT
ncbi:MAG: FAD-binding oxidoreductase [Cellvibrionaceae bacterium]|nr:FAD-binding oxidoreductase [Cellvibrionaceae bacterium]